MDGVSLDFPGGCSQMARLSSSNALERRKGGALIGQVISEALPLVKLWLVKPYAGRCAACC